MQPVSIEELLEDQDRLDRAALASPEINRFCSSSAWVLSAHEAFNREARPLLLACEGGLVALADHSPEGEHFLTPLETMWGFASPIVGPDPTRTAEGFAHWLLEHEDRWQTLWLSGLRLGSAPLLTLVELLESHYSLGGAEGTASYRSSLAGGFDGYLGRRSARFRQNIRRDLRRCQQESLWIDPSAPTDETSWKLFFDRILEIERRSWKGLQGEGIDEDEVRTFYLNMTRRLMGSGRLRALFARRGERDVGYIFGGLLGDEYRGLQMSYDETLRALGIGNTLQIRMIESLAEEGVDLYDLGMPFEYKRHWTDWSETSVVLIISQAPIDPNHPPEETSDL